MISFFPYTFLYFPHQVCIAFIIRKKDVTTKQKKRLKECVWAHNHSCPGCGEEGLAPEVGVLAGSG